MGTSKIRIAVKFLLLWGPRIEPGFRQSFNGERACPSPAKLFLALLFANMAVSGIAYSQVPACIVGSWRESKAGEQAIMGDFSWVVIDEGGSLSIRRHDGFVSGQFASTGAANQWTGTLVWGEGTVWSNVQLNIDSCDLIKTNQRWWFSRGEARQQAAEQSVPEQQQNAAGPPASQQQPTTWAPAVGPQPDASATAELQQMQQQAAQQLAAAQQAQGQQASQPQAVTDQPAQDPTAQQQDSTSVFGAFVNALGQATANADPNAIQDTLRQQLANINAARQQQQTTQQNQQTNGTTGNNSVCHPRPGWACLAR